MFFLGCPNPTTSDPATFTVTYDGNDSTGGAVPVDTNSYEEGAIVTVLDNTGGVVKAGADFAGWNTAADGSGTGYSAGDTLTFGAADVTLYAWWVPAAATVAFAPAFGEVTRGTAITMTTATEGAEIRYTIDGTEPTATSILYADSAKPVVNTAVTIKARVFRSGTTESEIASAAYTLNLIGTWVSQDADNFLKVVYSGVTADGVYTGSTYIKNSGTGLYELAGTGTGKIDSQNHRMTSEDGTTSVGTGGRADENTLVMPLVLGGGIIQVFYGGDPDTGIGTWTFRYKTVVQTPGGPIDFDREYVLTVTTTNGSAGYHGFDHSDVLAGTIIIDWNFTDKTFTVTDSIPDDGGTDEIPTGISKFMMEGGYLVIGPGSPSPPPDDNLYKTSILLRQ